MMAILCRRPLGSCGAPRAVSSQDTPSSSAESKHSHKPESVRLPQVPSPSSSSSSSSSSSLSTSSSNPAPSHSVEEKPNTSESSGLSSSFSHLGSLPLPLPIHLIVPRLQPRSVFPSPLKFLWFHRENHLEKDHGDKEGEEEEEEEEEEERNEEPLLFTSAPRLGDDDGRMRVDFETSAQELRGKDAEDEMKVGTAERSKSWVPNLVNLTYLWRKIDSSKSGGEEGGDLHMRVPGTCHDCECKTCHADHYLHSEVKLKKSVMSFEVPVVHDKDNFRRFLHCVNYPQVKFLARMSYLANQAYYIPEIKKNDLLKRYRLRFITSSLDRKAALAAKEKAALAEKEKLAGPDEKKSIAEKRLDKKIVSAMYSEEIEKKEASSGAAQATYAMAATAASYLAYQTKSLLPFKGLTSAQQKSVKEAAESEASSRQGGETQLKGKKDLGILEDENHKHLNYDAGTNENVRKLEVADNLNSKDIPMDGPAAVETAASATGLVVAEDDSKDAVAEVLQSDAMCPCEWFVCDEEGTSKRYFIIQGSDSLASWQANLLFESSLFEDPEWGVMVHRGFYEAAKGLYEQLMPLIQAHLDTHGDKAKFYFTGHSLGGSLATLLTLMLYHRGVLPLSAILPVYTFGSPSIMCGGDWLLKKLGFPLNHVQSVVMHYDIVPRSFACHYPDQVVEVLKRLNGTFRKHACLQNQKLMYAPMGKMMILQPDQQQAPNHPLLPPGSALYQVRHPNSVNNEDSSITDPHSHASMLAKEVRSAERSFLNSPHPLEILSDPGSYGSEGTISRDHDAASYFKALNTTLKEEFKKLRRLNRDQRRRLWGPSLTRTNSGKRIHRPVVSETATESNRAITKDRSKLRRSVSFLATDDKNLKKDIPSDSQMEPLSR